MGDKKRDSRSTTFTERTHCGERERESCCASKFLLDTTPRFTMLYPAAFCTIDSASDGISHCAATRAPTNIPKRLTSEKRATRRNVTGGETFLRRRLAALLKLGPPLHVEISRNRNLKACALLSKSRRRRNARHYANIYFAKLYEKINRTVLAILSHIFL